jgi:hypothetical protein
MAQDRLSRPGGAVSLLAFAVLLALSGCGRTTFTPTLHAPGATPAVEGGSPYLKVHMHSGDLYVLDTWTVPDEGEDLRGAGTRFDAGRTAMGAGTYVIPTADVALLETNRQETVSRFAMSGLSVVTALYGLTTIACLADPKSCFGSCPTFYTVDDPDRPVAEGFSSSFARALEAVDVDDPDMTAPAGPFALVMRNEALETHAVRSVGVRAAPLGSFESVLQTRHGELVGVSGLQAATACRSAHGDCLPVVAAPDDREYASWADSTDLAAREEVILDFGRTEGDVGIVLTARQSLVTTYVFYQSLAYAGSRAGDMLAALERGEPGVESRVLGVARELGGIEVFVSDGGNPWIRVGDFDEAGPIAVDRQVLPLGRVESADLRVKLVMARGSWRIDEVALAHLGGPVTPLEIAVDSVTTEQGADAVALARLADADRHLVTAPGDEHRLWFTLPEGDEYRVFLQTEGYYYEWMREPWLAEESALEAATVLMRPREALRRMAPGFKRIEPEMERLFWSSRFRR